MSEQTEMGPASHDSSPAAAVIAPPGLLGPAAATSRTLIVPAWNRLLDSLGLRASLAGVVLALVLIALLVLREVWLDRLPLALADPSRIYVAIVEAMVIGYLVAARVATARAARATLDSLAHALDGTPGALARVRNRIGQYPRLRFLVAGCGGAIVAVLIPRLLHDDSAHPMLTGEWLPELTLRRTLAPVLGWLFGTYLLVSVREAARVSHLATHLRSLDLFDRSSLAPFGRFGLQMAFRAVGLVSLSALFVAERDLGPVMLVLVLLAAVAAAAGLVLPVRGLRARIAEEKRRELACCREALRRARDAALVEQKSAITQHGRLSDVVAYKQLVESIDEWPIDTPTVLRASAYVGLPVLSWASGSVAPAALLRALAMLLG